MAEQNFTVHQNIIQKLKTKVPFFHDFSDKDIVALLQLSSRREFSKGEIIFLEGDPGKEMFIILSGNVKISKLGDKGNNINLADLSVGDCFGEMSVIDGSLRSAQAMSESSVILLSLSDQVLRKDLHLAYKLFKNFSVLMANRLRVANKNYAEMSSDEIKNRAKYNDIIKRYAASGGSFENCSIRDSFLENVLFSKSNLKSSMFVGAKLKNCRLNSNQCERSSFVGASLESNTFTDCVFNNSNFAGSYFNNVIFRDCNFDAITIKQLQAKGVKVDNSN